MKVACIQIAAYDLAHAENGLQRALEMVDEAGRSGADLIVLPECTYPAYFLKGIREYQKARLRPWDELVALFGGKAREYRCHIVVGLVEPAGGGRLCNVAALFGPDGALLGSTAKSFLWHFDQRWFSPGNEYRVFDTPIGRLGLLVCADGRMPEIARLMALPRYLESSQSIGALQGAQVIVDATAWVTGGGDRETLTSPQFEYLIPVRALENGVWFVVANKVGLEADSVLYCGRSCVIDPTGAKVVTASTDREEVLFADVDVGRATGIPAPRRPEAYSAIAQPTQSLPVAHLLDKELVPEKAVARIAALQLADRPSANAFLERVDGLLDTLSRQAVQLVVLPATLPADADGDAAEAGESAALLARLSAAYGCGLAAMLMEYDCGLRYRTCFLWEAGNLVGKYRKVHQEDAGMAAGDSLAVFETSIGRLGIMLDDEGLLPEVARCLMLLGADIILWPARESRWPLQMLARSRADENRVHVVLATPTGGGTAIVSATGGLMVAALRDAEQAIATQIPWMTSRYKEMAPHTDVVRSRVPNAYHWLVRR
ncbi:MAG: carbon-nitrogen hydrolase family protein [Chloroflexi bacterium]|nr:carbon-nitrogen hydrolase family protein [Chloroflexota bacterium]